MQEVVWMTLWMNFELTTSEKSMVGSGNISRTFKLCCVPIVTDELARISARASFLTLGLLHPKVYYYNAN